MSDRLRRRGNGDRSHLRVIPGGASSGERRGRRGRAARGRREAPRPPRTGGRLARLRGLWPFGATGAWSFGPPVVIITVLCSLALQVLAIVFPLLRIGARQPPAFVALGWLLVVGALVLWFVVIRRARGYYPGGLTTSGVFAYVRNPTYTVFIFLACPGMALLQWTWPGLALPLLADVLYRRYIPAEEARLAKEFGAQYLAYRRRVPGLVPRLHR